MPYASAIQVVNDANGTAYAFLADNGTLWQCQWNPQAQRWDRGQVVPGGAGARDLQALVVDNLWPSSGASGVVPGNAPGVVLAYRVGSGVSAQVVASFGAWGADGSLGWSEPVALSNGQGADEAFSLVSGSAGEVRLVLQKRESSASPQDLLSRFAAAPAGLLSQELDALASGDRSDSDLYGSTLQIQPSASGGYTLQLSGNGTSQSAALTPAAAVPTPAQAAPASGGNTQLSRAALAANTAPASSTGGLQQGSTSPLGASAPAAPASASGSFGFTRYGRNSRSLASLGLVPWRYKLRSDFPAPKAGAAQVVAEEVAEEPSSYLSEVMVTEEPAEDSESGDIRRDKFGRTFSEVARNARRLLEIDDGPISRTFSAVSRESLLSVEARLLDNTEFGMAYPDPGGRLAFSGLFGGLLAGAGGYTVANFSTLTFGQATQDQNRDFADQLRSAEMLLAGYIGDSRLKKAAAVSGSLKTLYQFSGGGVGSNRSLLSYLAQQSVGANFSLYRAKIRPSGSRVVFEGALGLYALMEQRYASLDGLPEWLSKIGLDTGVAGDALTLASMLPGLLAKKLRQFDFNVLGNAQLGPYLAPGEKYEKPTVLRLAGNWIGLASAALSAGTVIGAASADFRQYGTASWGVGSQQSLRLRLLSKYGVGLELIAGAQENTLWNFQGIQPVPDEQILVFGSVGAAVPFGGYIPLLQTTYSWNSKPAAAVSAAPLAAAASAPGSVAKGSYQQAPEGATYPFGYAPASASDVLLTAPTGPLASLISQPATLVLHQLQSFTAAQLGHGLLSWSHLGAGLTPGAYSNVPLIGVGLPGSAPATASFLVGSNGAIDPASLVVQGFGAGSQAGQYLALPQPSSGRYAFGIDVFQALSGNPAPPAPDGVASVLSAMPVFTLETSLGTNPSPLQTTAIERILPQLPLAGLSQSGGYPRADGSPPAANDNSIYTYTKVPVSLVNTAAPQASLPSLNANVTATVKLSGGSIVAATLDQPFYFLPPAQAGAAASYSLLLDLAATLADDGIVNPSVAVSAQLQALNDFTDQESFSANPAIRNAGVYLSAGLCDQFPLLPSYAHWPVQNRVSYVDGKTIVFLNNTGGPSGSWKAVYSSDLTPETLYTNPDAYQFTAASNPTAITDAISSTTYVFWVEASDPVIPLTGSDGEANYQAFMDALYGHQRINYSYATVSEVGSNTTWHYVSSADLYASPGNIITNLRAFNVQVDVDGQVQPRALLVWTELPISALQAAGADLEALADSPLAVIKTGLINPNAASLAGGYQWQQLFNDSLGKSTISTVPWTSDSGSGLSIADLSAAVQPIQVQPPGSEAPQTLLTPVLSWSQAVRTPYNEAVLNSQPLLFLPLGNLQSGSNAINLGSASLNTETYASSTGLNTAIAGALPKSSASAVLNVEGLGVLATGLGTTNKPILDQLRTIPAADRNSASADPIAIFSATIDGTTLRVSSLSQGSLAVGELVVGDGVAAGTTITAILTAATATSAGVYTLSSSNSLATATTLRALPDPQPYSYSSFSGSFSGAGGSQGYTTLSVSGLSGSLQIGDRIYGIGLPGGSYVEQVQSFDAASGSGVVVLNQGPQSAGGSYGLAALPGGFSSPYSIEFWTQLAPGSNPAGAGLVNLGQASAAALPDRPAAAPQGWLLSSSFAVERLTWQDALQQGLASSLPAGTSNSALYGWRWGLVADGANTTAMAGNGGTNLNRNALVLTNLMVGDRIDGVNTFLANYGLSSSDLLGLGGTPADQIASVPSTTFQFSTALALNAAVGAQVATTSLNGVAIDSSSALMNGGLVSAEAAAANANLATMLETLWVFQQQTGAAKVNFSLNPTTQSPAPAASIPPASQIESYGGFALQFALQNGPAVSVTGGGQIAFDVAPGQTLISPVATDLRDGGWHYVVVSFLPDYTPYAADGSLGGTLLNLPSNVGSASLYIDGALVGSVADVVNPYAPSNANDVAQLLSDNAGGAIDLLALYGQALSTTTLPPFAEAWPLPTSRDALALMKEAGFVVDTKTPNPGALPGAVSNHWLARTVDPNNALNSTYTATLTPNGAGGGTWTQAAALNPQLLPAATTPSASASVAQADLLIAINSSDWARQGWFNGSSTTAAAFNPSGQQLVAITVTLTPSSGSGVVTRTLTPAQVLLGANSLASLQPQSQNLAYTFLSNAPALSLLISPQPADSGDSTSLDPKLTYSATVTLQFAGNGSTGSTSVSNVSSTGSTGLSLGFSDSLAASLQASGNTNRKALASAAVVEEAPLQLKYVDSGEVFSSASADASPASSFATSQVAGYCANSNGSTQNGWLAIAQPRSANAKSDPAGRVWINYTGQFTFNSAQQRTAVSEAANAPSTWLNALAQSNFNPQAPNLPLLNDALYPSSVGGLLIQADPSAGWGQNFGATMLVADVNNDGTLDLIIAAPQANGGGAVVIVDGTWIAANLTSSSGQTILDLSNPSNLGSYVTVLTPGTVNSATDITTAAGFGSALAFDASRQTLWIGAPNYLRSLDASTSKDSTQPIGALYAYSTSAYGGSWGTASRTILTNPALGSGGTVTTSQAGNSSSTSWWGAQLGSAVAVASNGALAVSAPGVMGSMVYSGSELANQKFNLGNLNAKSDVPEGLLTKIQVGVAAIDATKGLDSPDLTTISSLSPDQLSAQQKAYLDQLAALQVSPISPATTQNNQAIQAAAVGAVVVFQAGTSLSSLENIPISAAAVAALQGTTFYGPNPYNTLGDSGFGSSLAFADLLNSNSQQLIIGASHSGGGGTVYTINPAAPGGDTSLGSNQFLAILAATNIFTAAESFDGLGNGLVSLGDVNQDGYDDVLLQAYNASSGAGNAYLLFGSDQLASSTANQGLSSLAAGSIGSIRFADGSSRSIAILSELGSGGALTGQGQGGSADINADGYNDILIGSASLADAYLTWGHPYLESIGNLQLSRLTSDNGFVLDGLASATQGSLRSLGDFNGDGYGDFFSLQPGLALTTVRIELGANTQEILADAPYRYYTFTVANGTQVLPAADINGDGLDDIALFLDQSLSSSVQGNQGAGSSTAILYGRTSSDLPLGSGFGHLAPVDPSTSAPLTSLPGQAANGGLTDAAPAVIAVGTTLYAVVKGVGSGDTSLWFSQSRDGGASWDSWSDLSEANSSLSTLAGLGPSLAFFNNTLYLAFVNSAGTLSLSSWDPSSTDSLAWSAPIALSTASGGTASFQSSTAPQLLDRGDSLGVLWVQGGAVLASSITDPSLSTSSWTPPVALGSLVEGTASPIASSAAPSFTWLGTTPVLAVNEGGTIQVYVGQAGGSSLQLATSFPAPADGPAIVSAPVLTTTETGLALTYTNADGSISLQRLSILAANGTPLPGVQISSDGGVDVSGADLHWQGITLPASELGTALATVPLSMAGNLLLANVRNSSSQNGEIWINAIPNLSDPDSTTWLNSTVQLSDGQGGWSISQQGGDAVVAVTPDWSVLSDGQSPAPPAFAEADGVLYAAVQGTNNEIYWTSSSNGGSSWASWQQLPSGMSTDAAPALAVVNGTLYLAYLGNGNSQINITSLTSAASNSWSSQYQIPGQGAITICMLNEAGNLVLYYQGTNDNLYRTSTTTPASSSGWLENALQYDNGSSTQTSSGQLAVASLAGTTYLAYQGGTASSPSNTIYLTSSSSQSTASSWSLVSAIPQASTGAHSGVGLTILNNSLILSYADQVGGSPVLALQQGTVSNNNWRGVPYATLSAAGATPSPQASLVAPSGSSQVLVASINANSSPTQDISTSFVAPQPLHQLLTAAQTGSSLSTVGDLNHDGFADLLVAANNVVAESASGLQLATGLRLIAGAATSSQITALNNSSDSSQRVQLAAPFSQGSDAPVAVITGVDPGTDTVTVSLGARQGSSVETLTAQVEATALASPAGSVAEASTLFGGISLTPSTATLANPRGWGQQALNSTGSFGDLNADGFQDFFDPAGNLSIATVPGLSYNLWSIRAAGDVNGNGVDDVLLALAPQGPAYAQEIDGQPAALLSVLVDGSLFTINTTTNSFRLDQLKTPLNPFGRSEVYDIASTSSSAYAPGLQNWFDPILNFEPGSLSTSSLLDSVNPAGAESYSPPSVAVSPQGEIYVFFSGADNFNSSSGSGLWYAYGANGSWSQNAIATCSNASSLTPSAAFYKGTLYAAYSDTSGDIWIAYSSTPEVASSWSKYQVQTTTSGTVGDESTYSSPTLIAENGRLALYFPTNNNSAAQQGVRYLYSRTPSQSDSWGGSLVGSGYSGGSGQMQIGGTAQVATSPIAATTFQGRTVLAFRGYNGSNIGDAEIIIATQDYTEIAGAAPSPTSGWTIFNTGHSNVNGVGLATDQALLYLTSSGPYYSHSPSTNIWSLSPTSPGSGTWNAPVMTSLSGSSSLANYYDLAVMMPFLLNGQFLTAWTNSEDQIQVSTIALAVNSPAQAPFAGYSVDGGLDVNGDGFQDVLISDPSDPAELVDNQYALFGGDYLNIASQVGTAGDDVLLGTPLADVIYGLQGSDQVTSNGGADILYTGSGDDQISIESNAFIRVDAGSGFDVLKLQGLANQAYDFRLNVASPVYFVGTKLRDVELISSVDYGANVLAFDADAVNAINPDRVLFLVPDRSDHIFLAGEFHRNSAFDTTVAGSLWTAYAAGTQTTPSESSPALVYVLNPAGASAADWLYEHVLLSDVKAPEALTAAVAPQGQPELPAVQPLISSRRFGDGLTLLAYRTDAASGVARFAIERSEATSRQLVAYASSSADSGAEPGRDYDPVAGLLILEVGEFRKEITVPLHLDAFERLGGASVGLSVEELQLPEAPSPASLHLVLSLDGTAADGAGLAPTVSGLSLNPSSTDPSALLSFRSDTNASRGDSSLLTFTIRQRSSADSRDFQQSYQAEILDEVASPDAQASLQLANRLGLFPDRDQLINHQVGARLELFFTPDRVVPSVLAVASTAANGLYGAGARIPITVTFSESVVVDSSGGAPRLLLNAGTGESCAVYSSGSGTDTLTFLYTVQPGQSAAHLDILSASALALAGATIQDAAGNQADLTLPLPGTPGSLAANSTLLIDGVAPVVQSLASANGNGTYGLGALLTLMARFSEPVRVNTTAGLPSLQLETGATDRFATYLAGSGSDTLTFTYTVQAGDSSPDLDSSSSAALALNGATLVDAAGNAADLRLPEPGAPGSLAANAALVVSGVVPQRLSISTATAVITEGATLAVAISSDTLAPGATTYWQFSGPTISAGDFSPAGLSGSIALGSDRRAAFSRSVALDALVEGDEALTLEFFADSSHTRTLGRALFTIRDLVPVGVGGATDGRDLLIGSAADEILNGVPARSALNGRNSYDTLTGNGGHDLFLLGTAAAVFYDDGIATNAGASDLAAITDFSADDRIQLKGSAADYRLASGRVSGAAGVMVYRLNPLVGVLPGATDELIGFVKGFTPAMLTLNDPGQFLYV